MTSPLWNFGVRTRLASGRDQPLTLSRPQRKVLRYLAATTHASERVLARQVFDAPQTTFGRPMLLGVPSIMRALERRGLVRLRPERGVFPGYRDWEITAE